MRVTDNSNFALCSVVKRLNTYEYLVNVFYHSKNQAYTNQGLIVEPQHIVVNGVPFKAANTDNFFLETTLKNRKVLFAITFTYNDVPVGDMFLLPSPKDLDLPIDPAHTSLIHDFIDLELQQAS
ncbi:MAG: hypothetical protein ACPGLV_07710 [Bacteroidia bacterium]